MGIRIIVGNQKNMKVNCNDIVIKKLPVPLVVFITILYEFMFVFITIKMSTLSSAKEEIGIKIFVVLAILTLVLIDIQSWNFFGKEIVIFEKDYIRIIQKGRVLKCNKTIRYNNIKSIEFERMGYSSSLSLAIFLGWVGGCIKVTEKNGEIVYFGQSLTAPEAKRQIIPKVKENIFEKSGIQF